MRVIYDEDTFECTVSALIFLRAAVATRVCHKLAVIEVPVPSGDGMCGFLVIDADSDEAIWSGHAFSQNEHGRAGAGHRKMAEIFDALGVLVKPYDHFSVSEIYPELSYDQYDLTDVELKILNLAYYLIQELGDDDYHVPAHQPILYWLLPNRQERQSG